MKKKITKRVIDTLKPQKTDLFIWDSDIPGFGVKVTPSGTRVYILQYRMSGAGVRRYTIGKHGTWTPDSARKEAQRLLGQVRIGKDPQEKKQAERDTPTMNEFFERYLKEHAVPHKKPKSVTEDLKIFRLHIKPALGTRRLDKITRTEIAKLHQGLKEKAVMANRAIALLSTMFNLAEKWGARPDGSNPCRHVKKFKERRRERFLSEQELARLGDAIRTFEPKTSPSAIAAIRLLILTGARLSEILTLRWEYVDLERSCLRLADSKTGPKTIQLNVPALEILAAVPRLEGNPFVLPGIKPGEHLTDIKKPWQKIRAQAGLSDVRLHDLRHSYASMGAGSGLGLPVIGALLGHTQAATTQRYAHLSADPLKQASDLIGEKIHAAMTKKSQAPVVEMKRHRPQKKGG